MPYWGKNKRHVPYLNFTACYKLNVAMKKGALLIEYFHSITLAMILGKNNLGQDGACTDPA